MVPASSPLVIESKDPSGGESSVAVLSYLGPCQVSAISFHVVVSGSIFTSSISQGETLAMPELAHCFRTVLEVEASIGFLMSKYTSNFLEWANLVVIVIVAS